MKHTTKLLVLAAAILGTLGLAAAGWTYWTTHGSGAVAASATVGTLNPPTTVNATFPDTTVRTVHVTWHPTTDPGGGALTGPDEGYYVQRYLGSAASPACQSAPNSLLSGSTVSCDDLGVGSATYTYKVTAVFRSWTATSNPSGTVTVPGATLASITISPTTATITAGGSQPYTATGYDQYGASMGDVTASTTFSISPNGSCTGALCTATTADSGSSHHTVTGNDSGKTATASLTVNPAAVNKLGFAPATPGPATAGSAIPNLAVSVEDTYNNVVTTLNSGSISMAIKSGGPQSSFTSGTTTASVVNGVASFTNLMVNTSGSYTLTATPVSISGVTSAVDSNALTISAAGPSKLAFTPAAPGPGTAGSSIPNVAVSVEDTYSNVVTTLNSGSISMAIKSGGPQSSFTSGTTTVSVVNGVGSFTNLVVNTSGSYTLTATPVSISGVTSAVDSNAFTVNPAAAASFTVSGFTSPTTAGVSHTFSVTVKDSFGNTATGYTGTAHFTSTDGQAVLPADYQFTTGTGNDNGTHSGFSATLKTAGSKSITATDAGTSSITGAQTAITVNPAGASKLAFTPAAPGPGTAGSSIPNVAVSVEDTYSNVVTSLNSGSVTMSIKTGSPQVSFTSGTTSATVASGVASFANLVVNTSGSYTLTAAPVSITGVTTAVDSNAFTVNPAAPALTFSVPCSSFDTKKLAGSNGKTTVTIRRGTDQYGNTVTDPNAGNSIQITLGAGTGSAGTWSPSGPITLSGGATATGNEIWSNPGSSGLSANPTASAPDYVSASCSYTTS